MLKSKWLVGLAGALLSAGCAYSPVQHVRNSPPESPLDTPLLIDGAMQLREWPLSTSIYASGDTIAKPTGFALETRWGREEWHYPIDETPLFIGQTLFLPVMAFITPPWQATRYTGSTIATTYNAMPAVPTSGLIPDRAPGSW